MSNIQNDKENTTVIYEMWPHHEGHFFLFQILKHLQRYEILRNYSFQEKETPLGLI